VYGQSIFERNANSLYEWLIDWGDNFGWIRTFSLSELQQAANNGRVSVICARRKNRAASGHITMVVPENEQAIAVRRNGEVVQPLESQAGTINRQFIVRNSWWTALSGGAAKYDGFGFWYTDQTKPSIAI
jgi:hypothetical protein